jgi:hypothetical protein
VSFSPDRSVGEKEKGQKWSGFSAARFFFTTVASAAVICPVSAGQRLGIALKVVLVYVVTELNREIHEEVKLRGPEQVVIERIEREEKLGKYVRLGIACDRCHFRMCDGFVRLSCALS